MPLTRARLYVLIDAFERDIRTILARYVLPDITEQEALGNFYEKALSRRSDDEAASDNTPLSEYLDLREAYDLLNTHRQMLPEELAREVRDLTNNLDRLVSIRKRVMHPRPLLAGDSDAAQILLGQFQTRYWPELRRTVVHLDQDPTWQPLVTFKENDSFTIHNLPLPDYDETGLVGRSKDATHVLELIRRGRESVITITGEGGIGKTALALDVAYQLVYDESCPFEMILWTSLKYERLTATGIRQIAGAARDIVGAIRPLGQVLDAGFQGSLEDLAEALAGLKVLIIFDNLETLGGLDFSQLYETLPDSVSYLITSRIGVGEYERRYPLAPLSEGDSLRLFNEFVRARRLTSLMRIPNDSRRQVIRRLRNSPLAIRWFVLAVEVGNDPAWLMRDQTELLEFCVRSVYESLDMPAREVLAALAVLARPVSSDELVVLLDRSTDDVNVGLQTLTRGSLVQREASGAPGDLVFRVKLTETATEFLNKRAEFDPELAAVIAGREAEYRRNEERRLADTASRSLAPIVVRTTGPHDVPTAQILRKALLASQAGNYADAFVSIETARRLNPDLWEVDRVEAFIKAAVGEYNEASKCYQAAYEKAKGEGRSIVAHFYAGHLARNIKDLPLAIEYEQEAHSHFKGNETAVALGNYLVWSRQFEAGIQLIEPALNSSDGKAKLIAIASLAEAYRRWAEYSRDEEQNPVQQFRRSQQGFAIAIAALEAGISDRKLRDVAADCAATALQGAVNAVLGSLPISDLGSWCEHVAKVLTRLGGTRTWPRIAASAERLSRISGRSAGVQKLYESVTKVERASDRDVFPDDSSRYHGEVVTLKATYGFIRHPSYPNNIFFHADDAIGGLDGRLDVGTLVSFSVADSDRGPRARDVQRQA